MNEKPVEFWVRHPEFVFIEGSSFGRVRTIDRYVKQGNVKRFVKGRFLEPQYNRSSYMYVYFKVNGKGINKQVHRLITECFLPNPDNLPEVNHKDCDRTNNCVDNLEWCTSEYNIEYREKYGEALNRPVYAVNPKTFVVLQFCSQCEAARELGVRQGSIANVIAGRTKIAGEYWFTEDKGEIDKNELQKIKTHIKYRGGVFAVNLKTHEVSRFESQTKAERILGINHQSISLVIRGRYNQANGFWFTHEDDQAVEKVRDKFGDETARKVEKLISKN